MLSRLARLVYRRSRRVLVGAVLLVIVAGAVGGPVAGILDSDDDFDPPSAEAVKAREAIADATGASATPDVIALVRGGDATAVAEAAAGPEVARVDPPVESSDGRSSYLAITLRNGADADPVVDRLEDRPGVVLGGPELIGEQAGTQVQEDLARAEMLAFPILFIVSLFVFRGVVAALLPLAVGMVTVLTTFLLMRAANAVELIGELDAIFATKPLEEWAKVFARESDFFWSPINAIEDVVADEQFHAAGGIVYVPDAGSSVPMVATPADFHGTPWAPRSAAPQLGEHTDDILAELKKC